MDLSAGEAARVQLDSARLAYERGEIKLAPDDMKKFLTSAVEACLSYQKVCQLTGVFFDESLLRSFSVFLDEVDSAIDEQDEDDDFDDFDDFDDIVDDYGTEIDDEGDAKQMKNQVRMPQFPQRNIEAPKSIGLFDD